MKNREEVFGKAENTEISRGEEGVFETAEPIKESGLELPAPLRKRGRPKKEALNFSEQKVIENKIEEKNKLKEIKEVIDKEFGGELEEPKTPEGKILLAEKRLKEMDDTIRELKENAKKNIEEFNRLFKSDRIMSNLLNKMWFEADRYDELNDEIVLLESELKRAEAAKKELESEIKSLKKEIHERNFQEDRKRSKVIKNEDVVSIENSEGKLKALQNENKVKELLSGVSFSEDKKRDIEGILKDKEIGREYRLKQIESSLKDIEDRIKETEKGLSDENIKENERLVILREMFLKERKTLKKEPGISGFGSQK